MTTATTTRKARTFEVDGLTFTQVQASGYNDIEYEGKTADGITYRLTGSDRTNRWGSKVSGRDWHGYVHSGEMLRYNAYDTRARCASRIADEVKRVQADRAAIQKAEAERDTATLRQMLESRWRTSHLRDARAALDRIRNSRPGLQSIPQEQVESDAKDFIAEKRHHGQEPGYTLAARLQWLSDRDLWDDESVLRLKHEVLRLLTLEVEKAQRALREAGNAHF